MKVSGGASLRSAASAADFRRAVDALKAATPISAVIGRAVQLKRSGREWKGCCPFHPDRTPSFTVVDAHERAYCFGCGWQGDILRFVMDREQVSFREAYRMLASQDLPTWTPQERAKAQAEDRLERLADEAEARAFYNKAAPVAHTPGQRYLAARGIFHIPEGAALRFDLIPSWRDRETREWGRKRPALICGAADLTGAIVGIQRIFFKNDNPEHGSAECKLSLGSVKGAALRLGEAEETTVLAEGPEDGLSIAQDGPGYPVWVGFGTGNMPAIELPAVVKRVIIAGQNNTAGRVAAEKTALSLIERGIDVDYAWPAPQFDDWNDQLRGALAA